MIRTHRLLLAALAVAAVLLGASAAFADTTSWATGPPACYYQFAADGSGNVYLPVYDAPSSTYVIKQYTGTGVFVRTVGSPTPNALAGSPDGYVYMASGSTVTRYDSVGHPVSAVTLPSGTAGGEVSSVQSLGADGAGNIYILDNGRSRVEKFSANGSFITEWGSSGDATGQFNLSDRGSLAVAADGTVFVADSDNRIQEFTTDGSFVTAWGSTGSGPGHFGRLSGIAVDAAGHVYATDPGPGQTYVVQEFDSSGRLVGTVAPSLPVSGIAAVATYGNDIVYGLRCGTVARFELTIPDASLSLSAPGVYPWQLSTVPVGAPVTAAVTASVPFGSIVAYAVDFGDGTPSISGSSSTAAHTYTAAGTYQITTRATSARGGVATTSRTITVVSPPVNNSPPSITGTPIEGQRLTEVPGAWRNGPITRVRYSWERCDNAGQHCVPIRGAQSREYVLTAADVGHRIRVSEAAENAIGMAAAVASAPTSIVRSRAKLTSLSVSRRTFRPARSGRSVTTSAKVGAEVRFTLNTPATVRFAVERVLDGRQVDLRCVAPSRKNRTAHRCSRYVPVRASFIVNGRTGKNRFRFTGCMNGVRLAPGRYRLVATPFAHNRTGSPLTAVLTILR